MTREHRAPSFPRVSVNRQGGWTRARPHCPSGGPISNPDAESTKHQAGPAALSLSHSIGFPSRRTHRHLPRTAAGVPVPSLPSQVLSKALEHPHGYRTGFSFEVEMREREEKNGRRACGLESQHKAPHIQLPSSRWATQGSLHCQIHALLGPVTA